MTEQQSILLIEDDPLLLDIYSTKFAEAGFALETADSGEKALKILPGVSPSIIVMDIVLPKVDGWELLEAMQGMGNLEKTKILVLSNLGQKEEIEKALSLGADKYLIKAHYTPTQVVEEIRSMIN